MKDSIKLSVAIIMFIALINQGYGQEYDLSDFQLPDMQRHEMDFNFGFQNHVNNSFYANPISDKVLNKDANGSLGSSYFFYRNTKKWQNTIWASVNSTLNWLDIQNGYNESKQTIVQTELSRKGFNVYESISSTNRFFFDESFFVEFSPFVYTRFDYSKYKRIQLDIKSKGNDIISSTYVPLKVGHGRIERVEDARQAMYIVEALQLKGIIKSQLSKEEMQQLAAHISQLKNERILDSREKTIYELEQMDQYLKENGLIDESSIEYFTTLSDLWEYGGSPARHSGFLIDAFLNPGFTVSKRNYTFNDIEDERSNKMLLLKTGIELLYAKPLSLKWQSDFAFEGYYGFAKNIRESWYEGVYEGSIEYRTPGLHFAVQHSLGFYPNTRTSISLQNTILLAKHIDKSETNTEEVIRGFKGESIFLQSQMEASYYISPRIRLNCYLGLVYQANKSGENNVKVDYSSSHIQNWNYSQLQVIEKNQFDYSLELALKYYIF